MPFNGSGVYSPPNPPTFPAVSGQTIEAAKFNAIITDLAAALTQCITKDGQTVITGILQWADAVANLAVLGGVPLEGNATINGVKTFSSAPKIPAATADDNPVTKAQLTAASPPVASEAQSGLVELATTAEVKTGTDTARSVTPAGLAAAAIGGSWQTLVDVTSSRAFGTTYTNNTGRLITCLVSLSLAAPSGAGAGTYILVYNGAEVGRFSVGDANGSASGYEARMVSFPVGPGATYELRYVAGTALTLLNWREMR